MSGPGKIRLFSDPDSQASLTVLLYNFDVDSPQLKPQHTQWLDAHIKSFLASGYYPQIVGLASRSGADAHNWSLSKARADNVEQYLQRFNPTNTVHWKAVTVAVGEEAARLLGIRDGIEDEHWRGVWLNIHPMTARSGPPSGPKTVPRNFDLLFIYDVKANEGMGIDRLYNGPNVYSIPARDISFLEKWLDLLVKDGMTFSKALWFTHGAPGQIKIGNDIIFDTAWRGLQGKGYDRLFPADAKIGFNGCNVAKEDVGWNFLEQAGRVFFSNGGTVFGYTSYGIALPYNQFLWPESGKVYHLYGNARRVEFVFNHPYGRWELPSGFSALVP
jgi:hypothetical protein